MKDKNGNNRYFNVIKVANPDLLKKSATVSFEPTTNKKGLSAYSVKIEPESKYIYIVGKRIKLTAIKSYLVFSEEVSADTRIDKESTVLSVGALMENIRPKSTAKSSDVRLMKKLAITTFQGSTLIFT
ncbi:MAG: cold shock domain-containing protein [Symbiopectobacterium sp.]